MCARRGKSLHRLHNTFASATLPHSPLTVAPLLPPFHRHLCQRINSLACRLSIKARNHAEKRKLAVSLLLQSLCKYLFIHCICFHLAAFTSSIPLLMLQEQTALSSHRVQPKNTSVDSYSLFKGERGGLAHICIEVD